MRTPILHTPNDHARTQAYRRTSGHLINQRARLRVLIYTMEHDQSIQPQPWQLLSLKRILVDIDRRIAQTGAQSPTSGVRSAYEESTPRI